MTGAAQGITDTLKHAISSPTTCSTHNLIELSNLLCPKIDGSAQRDPIDVPVQGLKSRGVSSKARGLTSKPTKRKTAKVTVVQAVEDEPLRLAPKERFLLATEVVNGTLKALTEALKTAPTLSQSPSNTREGPPQRSSVKRLSRSFSTPVSPLAARSLNRTNTFPAQPSPLKSSSSLISPKESGLYILAECSRAAFTCLRNLESLQIPGTQMSPLQLEAGMSALIGKLLGLGFDDLAVKEIRLLRRRLQSQLSDAHLKAGLVGKEREGRAANAKKPSISRTKEVDLTERETLAGQLHFKDTETSNDTAILGLVVTTQMQILRAIGATKKPSSIEEAVEHLRFSSSSSPANILLQLSSQPSSTPKAARQLENLSQVILSLCPSLSSTEDSRAAHKSAVSPGTAFALQALALEIRLSWWKLSGHQGDVGKDILEPLSKCLVAFARRSEATTIEKYQLASTIFRKLSLKFREHQTDGKTELSSNSALLKIHQTLGSLARDTSALNDAISWTQQALDYLKDKPITDARRCICSLRLSSLVLRNTSLSKPGHGDTIFFSQALESLGSGIKGDATELDELLAETAAMVRAMVSCLPEFSRGQKCPASSCPSEIGDLCRSIAFAAIRFMVRYLGNSPDSSKEIKSALRYEQRRLNVKGLARSVVDAVLTLAKSGIATDKSKWETVDTALQDGFLLLSRLEQSSPYNSPAKGNQENLDPAIANISNVYWTFFLTYKQAAEAVTDVQLLRCLRRSVDVLRGLPTSQRTSAFYSTKLDRLGSMYKTLGRHDEAKEAFTDAIQACIDAGMMQEISDLAGTTSTKLLWSQNQNTKGFGRAVGNLVCIWHKCTHRKTDGQVPFDSKDADIPERGLLLETELEAMYGLLSTTSDPARLHGALRAIGKELVGIYSGQYPIRRARCHLTLLRLATDHPAIFDADLIEELKSGCQSLQTLDVRLEADIGLLPYLQHLAATAHVTLTLRDDTPDPERLKFALSIWSDLFQHCTTWEDTAHVVDDEDTLLQQLDAIADFFEMQGLDVPRLCALTLICRIRELQEPAESNALTRAYTMYGQQLLRLGYSGRAGELFAKAEMLLDRESIQTQTKLQWQLGYSEYLIEIGNLEKWYAHLLPACHFY
jgi:separase